MVTLGQEVPAGAMLAKTPRKMTSTKDITGGLPRVAELFEARRPKDAAEIARIDGVVELAGTARGRRKLLVRDPVTGDEEEHLIPMGKHIVVYRGDHVKKGQQLTEGPVVPQEVLEVCGPAGTAGVPGQRSADGVPAAGRGNQRQAHRNHCAPDAAQGSHHGAR
jgi:DNA-directed RNA polymerase subunit beta'